MNRALGTSLVLAACVAWNVGRSTPVSAQSTASTTASAPSRPEPSAADRQAAGQAYDRATAAYLSRDYARAGQLFETAYRLAPASAALVQAVRSYDRAGNTLRASTLALRLRAFHADEADAVRQAEQVLSANAARFVRVDVTCDHRCVIELDGSIQEHTSFFVEPGAAHAIQAAFDNGTHVDESVQGAAGETRALTFAQPPDPIVEVATNDGSTASSVPVSPARGGGLSPAFFVTGLVATAAAGGVLVWSGLDTLSGASAYNADPTQARLDDGRDRELRTNVLIATTSVLAATTFVFALVTDWDGDPAPVQVGAAILPDAGAVTIAGRF